ncbi:MAG TPA: DUF6770 family protein [Cyclobacteriaceae bacterium]
MKRTSITAIILFVCFASFAQTYTKTGIRSVRLRNIGEVIQNNQVTGYYLFYNLERTSSQTNNYMLTVLDENLREINSVNVVRSKHFSILEASHNGNTFAIIGFDSHLNTVEIIAYDSTLKQKASVVRAIKGTNLRVAYGAAANGNETEQRFLVPVTNEGFLVYSVNESHKAHYHIESFDNSLQSIWVDEPAADAEVEMAFEAFQDSKVVGSLIESRARTASKDLEYDLLVNNTATGKTVFKVPVVLNTYTVAVSDVRHDTRTNEYIVFGEYYSANARETRDRSLGFMNVVYDSVGNLKTRKATSWEDMSRVTPLDEKGKFEGSNTSILFHNTIRTSDGQVFIVGEQYKKAANASGIALSVAAIALGGNRTAPMTQINIYNLVVFQFNPDFTINKVHVFEKGKSVMHLPQGSVNMSPKFVSNYAKAVGAFDYRFTQMPSDNSTFIVNYVDYDRQNEGGKAFVVGSIVYTPEKSFVTDKFTMSRRTSKFQIMKAKPGYILVSEYFYKDKKLESRLEKVNY